MHFCLSALHAQPRVVSVAQASRIISKGNCRLAPTIFGHHPRCRSRGRNQLTSIQANSQPCQFGVTINLRGQGSG
jgi:hypothetical protein